MAFLADEELSALQVQMAHDAEVAARPPEPSYPLAPTYVSPPEEAPATAYPLAPTITAPPAADSSAYGPLSPYVTPETAPGEYGTNPYTPPVTDKWGNPQITLSDGTTTWSNNIGQIWDSATQSWVDSTAPTALGNYYGAVQDAPSWADISQARTAWENAPNPTNGSRFDRLGFQEAPTNRELVDFYRDLPQPANTDYGPGKFALNYGGGQDEFLGAPQQTIGAAPREPFFGSRGFYRDEGGDNSAFGVGGLTGLARRGLDAATVAGNIGAYVNPITQPAAIARVATGNNPFLDPFNRQQSILDTSKTVGQDLTSGNALVKDLGGPDLSNLPYGLNYVTDAAFAPATWITAGAGSEAPIIGSAFKGGLGRRLLGETAVGAAGLFGGEKAAEKAAEYTDNPYLIGGAGVLGGAVTGLGVLGGIKAAERAPGAVRAADRALTGLDTRINEPATAGVVTAGSEARPGTTTVYHGTAGPLRGGMLEPDAFVTTDRNVAAAIAEAEARRNGGKPSVLAFEAEPGALKPTGVDDLASTAGGAQLVNDPAKLRPLSLAAKLSDETGGGVQPRLRIDHPNTLPEYPPIGLEASLGRSGIDEAIALKTETTAKPGPLGRAVGQIPGVKRAASSVNPSVNLDPVIHIANQAEAAVRSDIATSLSATRKPLLEQIDNAFRKTPEYIGPAENPLKGTFLDIAENPADYVLNDQQRGLLDVIARRDAAAVNDVRARFNSDIGLYRPQNEGAIYLPHINANEDLVQQVASAEAALSNPRIAKERVWDTARARAISDPTFKPEVKPERLLEAHDNAVAGMAGKQTFKEGSGGLTLIEAKEQIRPGLRDAREAAKARLDSLNGRMDTALRQQGEEIGTFRANAAQQRRIDTRIAPLKERVAELQASGDYGPELSHLSGQIYELRLKQAQLDAAQRGRGPRVVGAGEKVDNLASSIDIAQRRLEKLADQYKAVNVGGGKNPLVLNQATYKYHTPEASNSINALKRDSLGPLEGAVNFAGTMRATVLSSDLSPLAIQGQLNILRDPVSSAVAIAKMAREGGPSLDAIARAEPEMVSRYVRARGVPFGNVSPEFAPSQSIIGRVIPKLGRAEDKLFEFTQRMDYEAYKRNVRMLEKVYPELTPGQIDKEVTNSLSKTVPSLTSVERGVSPARAKLERAGLTSPSFLASPVLVAKDAGSAVAKLLAGQKPRGRELIALKQALTAAGTVEAITLGSAAMTAQDRGLSPTAAVKRALNPANKEFLALHLPGGVNIPLGGPFRSFIRGVIPQYKNGEVTAPDFAQFGRGRLNPIVGAQVDILRNKDFMGNKIVKGDFIEQLWRLAEYEGENLLPLSAGAVAEGVRTGQPPGEIGKNVIGQLAGTNTSFPTTTDKLNEIARGVTYTDGDGNTITGKDFYDLPSSEQKKIYVANPGLQKAAINGGSPQRQEAARVVNAITAKQQEADKRLGDHAISGDAWQNLYHANVDEIRLRKDEIYASANTKPGGDKWLDGYFKALDDATLPTGEVDWDKVDAYRATLPKATNDYIDRNTGLSLDTPVVKAYRDTTGKMDSTGYYDLRDKAWEQFKATDKRLADLPDYWTWRDQELQDLIKQYSDQGKDPRLVYKMAADELAGYKAVTAFSEYYRKEFRHQWVVDNPELAKTAIYFGLFSPDKAEKEFLGLKEPKK